MRLTTSGMAAESKGSLSVNAEPAADRLPASARVGRVRLAVSDLERSVAFYRDVIGLSVVERAGLLARLGAHGDSRVLLELEQQAGVRAIARQSRLGLYHTAFLLPGRADLSSFVQHLRKLGVPFGAGDHGVSEAIYLVDPDGLEVEVYADRPREQWPRSGEQLRMGTQAVRFDRLPAVAKDSWRGARVGTTVGHVHLYVGDLRRAAEFYLAGLGLETMVRFPSALFTSAGGYHHHVGLNVWTAGSPAASAEDARLLFWELALPDRDEVDRVAGRLVEAGFAEAPGFAEAAGFAETGGVAGQRSFADPWGITVTLTAAS